MATKITFWKRIYAVFDRWGMCNSFLDGDYAKTYAKQLDTKHPVDGPHVVVPYDLGKDAPKPPGVHVGLPKKRTHSKRAHPAK